MKVEPFLAPGLAWALVVLFSVLWIALGVAWGGKVRAMQMNICSLVGILVWR